MKRTVTYFLFFIVASAFSQDVTNEMRLKQVDEFTQSKLKPLIKELYSPKVNSEEQNKLNKELLREFEDAINIPETFNYGFDSLKKDIGILISPDKTFRIIHWNIAKSDGTFEYYGFIQSKHIEIKKAGLFRTSKTETMQLFPLIDRSSEIKNPENAITDNKKWFGALYSKIIVKETKSKTYYTLLGWDGNDKFSQKKIIEVLTFDANGTPRFGADIFNFDKKFPKRVIFEFSSTCNLSVRYSNKKDSIIFGHLAPTQPQFEGQFQYYCSDMSFDGFGFKKGKWNYGADVKAVNDFDEKDKLYKDPHDRSEGHDESNLYNIQNPKKKKKKK
ncbi:MAG: hypothetical protein NTX97_06600 [Bacteroidetes bacterium]|nr:hypothetical protein [Bacteroidota bacterium]